MPSTEIIAHRGIIFVLGVPIPELMVFIGVILLLFMVALGAFLTSAQQCRLVERLEREALGFELHARMSILHLCTLKANSSPRYEASVREFGQWLGADIRHVLATMKVVNEPLMQRFVGNLTPAGHLEAYASRLAEAKQR
jgi:hypothetical protein